jgi:hypothetical protein
MAYAKKPGVTSKGWVPKAQAQPSAAAAAAATAVAAASASVSASTCGGSGSGKLTHRRIDLRLVPWRCRAFGLLYFTGSDDTNVLMREAAIAKVQRIRVGLRVRTGVGVANGAVSYECAAAILHVCSS